MTEPRDSGRQLLFLRALLAENAWIDGDVLEIAKDTWAIHGVFPYDGQVPMAVFDTYLEAKDVLDEVRASALLTSEDASEGLVDPNIHWR